MQGKNDDRTYQLLVDKVLKGDNNAFKYIIKHTEGLVAQIVFKMIPNIEDRKDIAQDVYLKAFQQLRNFRFQSKLSTWIGQIAYNTCLNYLAKRKLILPGNEIADDDRAQSANETEAFIFRKELSKILNIEIDNLSPLYKTLITLYHNEELPYSEIAEITGLPEGTVKSYLFRARKTLKNNLLAMYKKEAL